MALARVQSGSGVNSTFASSVQSAALAAPLTNPSTIIVSFTADVTTTRANTPTDTAGNTYIKAIQTSVGVNIGEDVEVWYANNTHTTASNKVTVTDNGGGVDSAVVIEEWTGMTATTPFDKSAAAQDASAGTAIDSGATATLTQADEMVMVTAVTNKNANSLSLGTGFTNLTQNHNTSPACIGIASKIVSATTAVHGLMTTTSADWVGVVTTWKQASGSVSASITQVAATLTATGGTQAVTSVSSGTVAQVGATLTATGGTQAVATVQKVAISQVAATITATGGTQVVVTFQQAAIAQVGATITATGGTQTAGVYASVAQVGATLTATGGTQAIAAIQDVSISQTHATLTATGGTQAVATIRNISLSQVAATLTVTGGTQSLAAQIRAAIAQQAATLTISGGLQSIRAITPPNWVRPTAIIYSGSKGSIVDSGLKIDSVQSSAKLDTVTSGTKNEILQSGDNHTTVTSGSKGVAL